jgi:hypothetical protein
MSTAVIVTLVVVGLLIGLIITLRNSAKTGMPSQEVLDRTTQRARELDAREAERDKD